MVKPRMAQPDRSRDSKGLKRPFLRRRKSMQFVNQKVTFELEIQIEELEAKIAPDGGETVLPLPIPSGKKH